VKVKTVLKLAGMLLGSTAYIGLAVLGRGGFTAFFSDLALTALAAVTLALTAVAAFAGGSLSPGVREDRGNRWVIPVFFVIGLLSAYLPARADREEFWVIDGASVRWVGVALFAVGVALRLWPVFVLGNRFSGLVAIQPDHALVTCGIYRDIRHPSYLGLLISTLGWGLAFNSWVGVLLAAVLLPPLIARIHAEERLLASQFGDEYAAYRSRTWRLIPGVY
jgi:protein-S-isoprenylcysteine O-methyltransferase Ste14